MISYFTTTIIGFIIGGIMYHINDLLSKLKAYFYTILH